MARRRSYQQFCGVARALDSIGERWTLLIARNLLLGPRRYTDLLAELPGITTNLLAKRLREMQAAGLLEKRAPGSPGPASLYELTEAGAALEPIVMELGRWGGRLMDRPRRGDRVDLALALLALKRRYRGGLSLTVGVETEARRFALRFSPDRLVVRDRAAEDPDLVLGGDEQDLRALFTGAAAPAAPGAGPLRVSGHQGAYASLLEGLGLGAPAGGDPSGRRHHPEVPDPGTRTVR
jgi:DNA-binding HxlR family transcriptional regulator